LEELVRSNSSSLEEAWRLTPFLLFGDQVATLPPLLSYTPVTIPLSAKGSETARHATLFRRDLFDARFQVLNQDEHDEESEAPGKGKEREEVFVDESSDLVKGVYEGGLKTWECSLDLVDCLDQRGYSVDQDLHTPVLRGKGILEVRKGFRGHERRC
jgi:protein-histidine N-methyltransferase